MMTDNEIFIAATEYIRKAGISPYNNGYRMLRSAVCKVVQNPEYLDLGITKRLYPVIAEEFGSTAVRVERNIRVAIRKAWRDNPAGMADAIAFTCVKKTPTNTYVIASISDAIIVDDIKRKAEAEKAEKAEK